MAKNNCQKKPNFLEILGTKVVQFWCYTKLIKTKKLLLNWYFSTKIFFRKIRRIFDIENRLWKSDFGTFWHLFLAIEQVSWKNQCLFLISAIIASIWNVFIKFRWHDEKLTFVLYFQEIFHPIVKHQVQISMFWRRHISWLTWTVQWGQTLFKVACFFIICTISQRISSICMYYSTIQKLNANLVNQNRNKNATS